MVAKGVVLDFLAEDVLFRQRRGPGRAASGDDGLVVVQPVGVCGDVFEFVFGERDFEGGSFGPFLVECGAEKRRGRAEDFFVDVEGFG
jgi:hypothetical protein